MYNNDMRRYAQKTMKIRNKSTDRTSARGTSHVLNTNPDPKANPIHLLYTNHTIFLEYYM